MLHFHDSSTSRSPLLNQSEQLDDDGSQIFSSKNRNTILINDHDVGDVSGTAVLFPIEKPREIEKISDANLFRFEPVPSDTTISRGSSQLQQFTFNQNDPAENFPNDTVTGYRILSPVQNDTVKVNPNAISIKLNPKKIISSFTSTNIYENQSVHYSVGEESTEMTSAGLLKFDLYQNNYKEDGSIVTSAEALQTDSLLEPINDCNANVTSATLLQVLPIQNIVNEQGNNTSSKIRVLDRVPRTKKIITDDDGPSGVFDYGSVINDKVEDSRSMCKLDLLKTFDLNRISKFDTPFSKSCNESLDVLTLPSPIDGNDPHHMDKTSVLWNDMFDTELLPAESYDLVAPAVKDKIIQEQNAVVKHKQFKISFPKENMELQAQTDRNKKENKHKLEPKRKREKMINKEKRAKRLKENNLNIKKNLVSKEKYTTTVKKWLDAVDPNNPVETESIQEINNVDSNRPVESEKKTDSGTIAEKKLSVPKKQKVCKKVVQARLANKGGVMKFDKPVQLYRGKDEASSDIIAAETTSKATNRVSSKKSKSKFVAPLKSQKPVKEIDFNVLVVDENNWKEHVTKLNSSNTTEIYTVLTYSNGFCQLNKQFTEDDCIPDGVMLLIDEEFYYFQKIADAFSDVIIKFMENRTIVCYDGKNILIFLKHHFELKINFCMQDVQIGGSLLEPDSPPESFGAVQKLAASVPQHTVATACPRQKAAWYLTLLRECADKLKGLLVDNALWSLFQDIEMPVLPVIAGESLQRN